MIGMGVVVLRSAVCMSGLERPSKGSIGFDEPASVVEKGHAGGTKVGRRRNAKGDPFSSQGKDQGRLLSIHDAR